MASTPGHASDSAVRDKRSGSIEAARTPRPWILHHQPEQFQTGDGLDWSIQQENGRVVALLCPAGGDSERWRADAALIVRAVNAHDDMLAALKGCVEMFADRDDDPDDDWTAIQKARAAIARAEGR